MTGPVTGATEGLTPALDLGTLLDQLMANGNMQLRGDMSQEEMEAMKQIETTFTELRQELEKIENSHKSINRRQLDILSSLLGNLPLVGDLLGGGSGGGDLLGGLTGGLGGILGKVKVEDLNKEEMNMLKEAEGLLEELTTELVAEARKETEHHVQRRQLDILFGLPIVGPLLQSLLGGVGGGAGGSGGLDLGGLTGGLTGSVGGLTGGLLGKVKLEDLHVTEEQMAMARKADTILSGLASKLKAEGRAQ